MPQPLDRRKESRYPLCMMLHGPQGRPGFIRENFTLLGFDSRAFRSVASRYTDCVVSAHEFHLGLGNFCVLENVPAGSWCVPAGSWCSRPFYFVSIGAKAAGAWIWPHNLLPRLRMSGSIHLPPPLVCCADLNRGNFIFLSLVSFSLILRYVIWGTEFEIYSD
jgi:hypothetical protein